MKPFGANPISSLPQCIIDSEEFRALTNEQRGSITQRIRLIKTLLENMSEWTHKQTHDPNDAWIFLDNLELDSWSIASIGANEKNEVSAWLIHSSWTFELSPTDVNENITKTARDALNLSPPALDSEVDEIAEWTRDIAKGLSAQIHALERSVTQNQGIASLVIIDAFVSLIHAVATKTRANPRLSRPK